MHTHKRDIKGSGTERFVDGIPVWRDADFGIIFEKNYHLQLAKDFLDLQGKDCDFYPTWDRDVAYYALPQGGIVAMTHAQGSSFAACAVERMVRTGVSHVVRIGTCGSLSKDIDSWSLVIVDQSLSDEKTSEKYREGNHGYLQALMRETLNPLGSLYKQSSRFPSSIISFAKRIFGKQYEYYMAQADVHLCDSIHEEIDKMGEKIYRGTNITNCARYLEDEKVLQVIQSDIDLSTIDMETSAILSVAKFHGLGATAVQVVTDNPISDSEKEQTHDRGGIKSKFIGATHHGQYREKVDHLALSALRAILDTYDKISQSKNYILAKDRYERE